VPGGGHVAGGEDAVRPEDLQPLIDQYAVPDGQAGRLGQLGPRDGAGADQYQVAFDGAAVAGDDRLGVAVAATSAAAAVGDLAPAARPSTTFGPPATSSSACPPVTTPPWPSSSPAPSKPTPPAPPRLP